MKSSSNSRVRMLVLLTAMSLCHASFVQAQDKPAAKASADKTGTNPVNFQRDIRVYNEYQWLNTAGDGDQNVTTLEFRTPFLDGKWQFRARARYSSINADLNDDGVDDVDEAGLGDMDFRFLTVIHKEGLNVFAGALEVFLDTASDDALGSGTTSLGPQAFYVRFFRGGFGPYKGGGLFAPGLQYKFSIDEDDGRSDTDQILIDLNFLMMAKDKQSWFFSDPQIVIDRESDKEFALIDLEFGWMMTNWFKNLKGHSFYVRPSFGLGRDRPTDASIEIGYKIVGW